MTSFWHLERFGQAPALYDGRANEMTYRTLARTADDIVAGLPERTLFALEFTPTCGAVAAYLGGLRRGHVALLLDGGLAESLKSRLLDQFRVERVFDGTRWYGRAIDTATAPVLHPDLSILMSTSGSTGSPKLVRLSSQNLQSNADSIVAYMCLASSDRAISSLPLHYSYGLSVLNSHLAVGGSMVLTDDAVTSADFWKRFREFAVTGLAGVPTSWRMLRRLRVERMVLPSLRLMTQAGGRLDPEEVTWLSQVAVSHGRQLFIMYGQTEATARIAYLPANLVASKPGCIGQAIPGGTLRLIDAEGRTIDDIDAEGELVYSGPNVMLGYAESPYDLARGAEIKELHTGDLGRRDSDGHYWITGRLKRFVKVFGNRFSLDEVERHLRSQDLNAAVVGRDDQLMVAVVGDASCVQTLRDELATHYRIHASAISVSAVPDLPRNSAGKVLHAELMSRLSASI